MELICYVVIPGKAPGKRMGLVKWYEIGYYPCDYDQPSYTAKEVEEYVDLLNARLEIPKDVAQSAAFASVFGWHVPAAQKAVEFFKQQSLKEMAG